MKINYTLTLADFKAALRLHDRHKRMRRLASLFWFRLLPICLLLYAALSTYVAFTKTADFVAPVIIVVCVSLVYIVNFYGVRNQFAGQYPSTARSESLDIDDERIICINSQSTENKYQWNGIEAFAQDEKIAMLYVARIKFIFFPTAVLSAAQRAELDALVARHVTKRKP